jgi:hypothetical protein
LILRFYFTMVLNHYFTFFLSFPWLINYNHTSWCIKFSTHSSLSWFWLKIFSFIWIHGVMHEHIVWASSHTNEWKTTPWIIPKFDINPTPLWWKSQTAKNVLLFQSWTPLSLVLLHFLELLCLGDFVVGQPCFWWWSWNYLRRFLQNWRHFYLCMVFNSQRWTLSLVARFDLSTTS